MLVPARCENHEFTKTSSNANISENNVKHQMYMYIIRYDAQGGVALSVRRIIASRGDERNVEDK